LHGLIYFYSNGAKDLIYKSINLRDQKKEQEKNKMTITIDISLDKQYKQFKSSKNDQWLLTKVQHTENNNTLVLVDSGSDVLDLVYNKLKDDEPLIGLIKSNQKDVLLVWCPDNLSGIRKFKYHSYGRDLESKWKLQERYDVRDRNDIMKMTNLLKPMMGSVERESISSGAK
jgi:hypothetical protein